MQIILIWSPCYVSQFTHKEQKSLQNIQTNSTLKSHKKVTKRKRRNESIQNSQNYQKILKENSHFTLPLFIALTDFSFSKIFKFTIRKTTYIPFSVAQLYFSYGSKTVISECTTENIYFSFLEVTGSLTWCKMENSALTHVLFTSLHPSKRKKKSG